MAQALFKRLKQCHPNSILEVVAPEWSRPLTARMPEIHKSHSLLSKHGELNLLSRFRLAQALQSRSFDQAIVLPNSWKSALIPWLAKIPVRTGFRGEMRFGLLNDIRTLDKYTVNENTKDKNTKLTQVDRFIALAHDKNDDSMPISLISSINSKVSSIALTPSLVIQENHIEAVLEKFSLQRPKAPILALCPGAEFGESKRWPIEYFAEIAKQKLKAGWSVWLFGSTNDVPIAQAINALTEGGCINFTGKTELGEAIDLLSLSTAVVSNDSGLMHIAAALQKPLVALYGSTDPKFTPPLCVTAKILRVPLDCSPCLKRICPLKHHRCMRELSPTAVAKALNELLDDPLEKPLPKIDKIMGEAV